MGSMPEQQPERVGVCGGGTDQGGDRVLGAGAGADGLGQSAQARSSAARYMPALDSK
jgi:hypothetical protein